MAPLSLRGTLWRLQALQDSSGPTLIEPPGRPPELLLAVDQERVCGTGGCNRLIGGFQLAGEELSFFRTRLAARCCCSGMLPKDLKISTSKGWRPRDYANG